MALQKKADLIASISGAIPDNNSGAISAADVRNNMVDTVDSINNIVGSGNHDTEFPFTGSNVRAKIKDGSYGQFIAESGIYFPNSASGPTTGYQYNPYPGAANIDHGSIAGLTDDDHLQYLPRNGARPMESGIALGHPVANPSDGDYNWIGASGTPERGIGFDWKHYGDDIHVGNSGTFIFKNDASRISSGKGVAKAWINFEGSGDGTYAPNVRSAYNIKQLNWKGVGKYQITFQSGVFKDNNYVVCATSNSRTATGSLEDFDINTVGVVLRQGDDLNNLRTLTVGVLNKADIYVDGEINDIVVFGMSPDETRGFEPDVTVAVDF